MKNEREDGSISMEQREKIIQFTTRNFEIRGQHVGGWVIKAPFSTGKLLPIYSIKQIIVLFI